MITIFRNKYRLLLSYNPCDLFKYYNVHEMHGLNIKDCQKHKNTSDSSYICGLCNYEPREDTIYKEGDPMFVYINLSRCRTDVETFGNIMHELMHRSFELHSYNPDFEEEIITWAEKESHEVFKLVKPMLGKVVKTALNQNKDE